MIDFKRIDYKKIYIKMRTSLPKVSNGITNITKVFILAITVIFIYEVANLKGNSIEIIINNIFSLYILKNIFILVITIVEQYSSDAIKIISIGFVASIVIIKVIVDITIKNKFMGKYYIMKSMINIILIIALIFYIMSFTYNQYFNECFSDGIRSLGSENYLNEIDGIITQINDKRVAATIAFASIVENIRENNDFFINIGNDLREEYSKRINIFIDIKGEVANRQEHYFRNNLNVAPKTLDELVNTEEKNNWVLLKPSKATYHMTGVDGAYNLKFVSKDGHREAVYNKAGLLLTEKNDANNMGTYNYADTLVSRTKHIKYDVQPYDKWGNIKGDEPIPSAQLSINLINYYKNEDAQRRYEEVKKKMNN